MSCELLAQILVQHVHRQGVEELLTQLLVLLRRDVHHLILQERMRWLIRMSVSVRA